MKIKHSLTALALAGLASPVFAEGATSEVSTAVNSVQSAMESALTTIAPAVTAVVVAGVAIWLVPRAVRLVKSGFSAGAGR